MTDDSRNGQTRCGVDLVIFDIDGTLLDTSPVDDACYTQAVADVFGVRNIDCDWSAYRYATDIGILQQIVRERLERDLTDGELKRFRDRFVELLRDAYASDPSQFHAIPGAAALLAHLGADGRCAALATGGFQMSARFKLDCAGLDCSGLPAAFSEDGPSREEVLATASARTKRQCRIERFDRIVSIGDGVWDVRAARTMKMCFIGIANGDRAARLRNEGAMTILPDFSDLSHVLEAIDQAQEPVPITSWSRARA